MTKVVLRVRPRDMDGRFGSKPLLRSLPFFKSGEGTFTHRVRSGTVYWDGGEYGHTAVNFWCGNSGSLSSGELSTTPPTALCRFCDAKFAKLLQEPSEGESDGNGNGGPR